MAEYPYGPRDFNAEALWQLIKPSEQPQRRKQRPDPEAPRWLYQIQHLVYEPRDFAYAAPRRAACRILGRHNSTCAGRPDHHR